MNSYHIPVLSTEVLTALSICAGKVYIDCTFGGGGHSREILKQGGRVIAFDVDPDTSREAQRIKNPNFEFLIANFIELKKRVPGPVAGVLLDLGESSHQLDDRSRGFSFQDGAAPLDMRMDTGADLTAAKILNTYSVEDLRRIFRDYGEDPFAGKIAGAVARRRAERLFQTVNDLLETLKKVYPAKFQHRRTHFATNVFRALRIEVNQEIENLKKVLPQALDLLAPGGRLAVITFHSLEDRVVKQFLVENAKGCICPPEIPECRCNHHAQVKIITKKPIIPAMTEINQNPRARSAKLRVGEKI